jgi:site-specific DNA-methyltransferase (adenine-specific)
MLSHYLDQVFWRDALSLLRALPGGAVDAVISDPMFGSVKDHASGRATYEWGTDPGEGDPTRHWAYHRPIYQECLRILRPDGVLAWAQSNMFVDHFQDWFGGHRVWVLGLYRRPLLRLTGKVWVVQNKVQEPVRMPDRDAVIEHRRLPEGHPCPKSVEEMLWMVEALTTPGQVVVDPFCGLGATLLACQMLGRRWIGCDIGVNYVRHAKGRLSQVTHTTGLAS